MSDPVNSSDEAIHAAAVALANSAKLPGWMQLSALGRDMTPIAQRAVEAAYPVIAAAVRAEAVAGERRRIADEIAQDIHGATLANPELIADFGYNRGLEKAADIARRSGSFDVRASDLLGAWSDDVAAGSVPVATPEPDDSRITNQAGHAFTFTVELRGEGFNWSSTMVPQTVRAYDLPAAIAELSKVPFPAWFPDESDEVATPPAEPAARRLNVMEAHLAADCPDRDSCWARDFHDEHSPQPAPSQPVTCAHWKTERHVIDLAWPHKVWCPGPVSVPKESSE